MSHHTLNLKSIKESEYVMPEFWDFSVEESLKDLGFNKSNEHTFSLNHEEMREGKELAIQLSFYKKQDGSYVEYTDKDGAKKTFRFKGDDAAIRYIHSIFEKF